MRFRLPFLGMILFAVSGAFPHADPTSGTKPGPTASPSPSRAPGLDEKSIHAAYTEGDFETVVAQIETYTRANKTYSKEDSIFIAKHLAVIYTANPVTREKGKNYMFRLLDMLPSAKIVDMFVSDEIDHIFERVREEYAIRLQAQGKEPPTDLESHRFAADKMTLNAETKPEPVPANPSEAPAAAKPAARSRKIYWVAGGTALLAATGALTYLMLSDSHATQDKVYDVPH